MPVCTTNLRVRYAETDQMGVVYYANYLVWFELGRTDFLRQFGFTYEQMEREDGCLLPVVEAICRYRAPARYDDAIFVETTLLNLRSSVIKFGYRILKSVEGAAPKLLAEGETVHVFVDRQMQRTALPEKYANPLKAARTETDSSQYRDIEANGNAVHSLL